MGMKYIPPPHKGARVIKVIETTLQMRGDGKNDPYRLIRQYWSLNGELLGENDDLADISSSVKRDGS